MTLLHGAYPAAVTTSARRGIAQRGPGVAGSSRPRERDDSQPHQAAAVTAAMTIARPFIARYTADGRLLALQPIAQLDEIHDDPPAPRGEDLFLREL